LGRRHPALARFGFRDPAMWQVAGSCARHSPSPPANGTLSPSGKGARMGELLPDGPVTILFSDVEGSTDLRTERGDVVAHGILRAHEEVVRSCVSAHDGREVKALGDGFMLAFASVRKALACAQAIQVGLAERNAASPCDEVQ